jgi:hypothetical protein
MGEHDREYSGARARLFAREPPGFRLSLVAAAGESPPRRRRRALSRDRLADPRDPPAEPLRAVPGDRAHRISLADPARSVEAIFHTTWCGAWLGVELPSAYGSLLDKHCERLEQVGLTLDESKQVLRELQNPVAACPCRVCPCRRFCQRRGGSPTWGPWIAYARSAALLRNEDESPPPSAAAGRTRRAGALRAVRSWKCAVYVRQRRSAIVGSDGLLVLTTGVKLRATSLAVTSRATGTPRCAAKAT